jgi:hypothetical protein
MLAFVHLHKTAGITVNWILRRSFGIHHYDVEPWNAEADFFSADDYHRLKNLHCRIDSISGHKVRAYSDLSTVCTNVRYYTFLREPLIRCASNYQYVVQIMKKHISFEDWMNGDKARNYNYQTKRIANTEDLDTAVKMLWEKFMFVGLVERFDESLVMFQRKVADERLNICYSKRNVAPSDSIKSQILNDPKSRALLEEANKVDSALYEFVRQDLYPRYMREYGDTLSSDVVAFKKANRGRHVNPNLALNYLNNRLLYKPLLHWHRRSGRHGK